MRYSLTVKQGYSDSRISNMIESMVGLLEKDMITVIRMESGEYFWKSTKIGDEYVKNFK